MDQREHELSVIREYLKIGLKKEGFSGTTWIDAYFVKHIEKGMISEELTDPLCLSFHDAFQAEKVEDGTVQGLPTILYRFNIDFDAPETLDKLAEIVRSWYMSGADVMSVRDYANLSCVKFMDALVKMGRNSLFEPYGPHKDGFDVSYLYRDGETLDALRELVHEILYWKKSYDGDDDAVYEITYRDREQDEVKRFAFSYDEFLDCIHLCSTVNAAIEEYSVVLLSKVNPKAGTYVRIKRVASKEKEETFIDENETESEIQRDERIVDSFKSLRSLARNGSGNFPSLTNEQFSKLCCWIYQNVSHRGVSCLSSRTKEDDDQMRIAVELLLEAERIEWFNGAADVQIFYPVWHDDEENDAARQSVFTIRNVAEYLDKLFVFSMYKPF